jgi:DNA-binding XRE family transcriptional regulator
MHDRNFGGTMTKRLTQKIRWTPADRARHKEVRERLQKERPSLEQLLASGEYEGPVPLGVYFRLRQALTQLRKTREAAGLSLAEVAARSGIDKAALSRLENGIQANPTVDTLLRYAAAVGKQIHWTLRDMPKNGAKRKSS